MTDPSPPQLPKHAGFTRIELVVVIAIIIMLLVACLGIAAPFQAAYYLVAGWIHFLIRVLPQATVNWAGVGTAAVALVAVVTGIHLLGQWWLRNTERPAEKSPSSSNVLAEVWEPQEVPPPGWPARRTIALTSFVLLLFVAGLCGTAIAHQFAWLATSPEPLLNKAYGAREAAWRTQSKNNFKQIGIALYNYQDVNGRLPAAGTFDDAGRGLHSWQTYLLPYIEQQKLFETIDLSQSWSHPANAEAFATRLPVYVNPRVERDRNAPDPLEPAKSHYAGNAHVFGTDGGKNYDEITDGPSNTLLAGEAFGNFKAWGDPTNVRDPVLGINTTLDGFGGPWSMGGAQFLLGDGAVRFVSEAIDPKLLKALATPDAGDDASGDW